MADANEKIVKRKEREPITLACFVVFIIACAGVLSAYAYDNFIADNSEGVVYGDTVVLDYTGSLYGFYDEATDTVIPVVFDTTMKDAYDSSVLIAGLSKDKFETTSITLGQGKFLKAFENAVIGNNVGDTIKVVISAKDAYPTSNGNYYATNSESAPMEFARTVVLTTDEYKTLFDVTDAPSEGTAVLNDKYGLPASVSYGQSMITVTYQLATDGTEYQIVKESKVGNVTLKVIGTEVKDDAEWYKVTLTVDGSKPVLDEKGKNTEIGAVSGEKVQEIEMISFNLFGQSINVVGYGNDASATAIVYNTATTSGNAIHNMDLYFVIKIVSKS